MEEIIERLEDRFEHIGWEEVQDEYDIVSEDPDYSWDELPIELDEDTLDQIVKEVNGNIDYTWENVNDELNKEYIRSCWVA